MKGENAHPVEPGGGGALAPIRARAFWMPASTRLAVLRAASVINRHEAFARRAIHLPIKLAHYNRSASPLHWSQLPLSFLAENLLEDDVSETRRTDDAERSESGFVNSAPDVSRKQQTPPTSSSFAVSSNQRVEPPDQRAQTATTLHTAPSAGAFKVSDFITARPRAASRVPNPWQPISLTVKDESGAVEDSWSGGRASAARRFRQPDFHFEEEASSKPSSTAQSFSPRLKLSTSLKPRREIRGGFPGAKTQLAMRPEDEPQWPRAEVLSPRAEVEREDALSLAPLRNPTSQALQSSYTPAHANAPQGAIEKLIERSIMPEVLPGLEMRLVRPEEQPSGFNEAREASETRHQPEREQSDDRAGGFAPPPPQAPALNINEVADKVYQTLMRRQQLERERRGLY